MNERDKWSNPLVHKDYEVKTFSGVMRMQSELQAAFAAVAPKDNWKGAIKCQIEAGADLSLYRDAVVHFTGSMPDFAFDRGVYNMTARGYYAAIGA